MIVESINTGKTTDKSKVIRLFIRKSDKARRNHMHESIQLLKELDNLSKTISDRIKNIDKRLKKAPQGLLRVSLSNKTVQYYQRTNTNDPYGKYLTKKDRHLAEQLAQKDYDTKLLKVLKKQQKAIENFIEDYDPDAAEQVYMKLSEQRKALVTPEFLSDEEYVKQWLSQPYTRLGFKDEDQEFYTSKGERVRSKSEILIADALMRNDVPYLCECPVYNNGVIFAAPDFKCLNRRLRKVYYWEHLGMIGDQDYANRNVKKMDKYILADDFDESRLILTFETDSHPLNTKVIEAKIRKYLL